jgi:hypothetical protein
VCSRSTAATMGLGRVSPRPSHRLALRQKRPKHSATSSSADRQPRWVKSCSLVMSSPHTAVHGLDRRCVSSRSGRSRKIAAPRTGSGQALPAGGLHVCRGTGWNWPQRQADCQNAKYPAAVLGTRPGGSQRVWIIWDGLAAVTNGGNSGVTQNKQERNLNRRGDGQMLWMLWLLAIPVLGACLFLFALGRVAARPCPSPSPISAREPERGEERSKGCPATRRRLEAGPLRRGLSAQTGSVRFLAETRKRRPRRHAAKGAAQH